MFSQNKSTLFLEEYPRKEKKALARELSGGNKGIYVIDQKIDLEGDTISFDENVVLKFEDGQLYNGYIVFNKNRLLGTYNSILCECSGSVVGDVLIDYFGVSPTNDACNNTRNIRNIKIENFCYKFGAGVYKFDAPIEIRKDCEYVGESRRITTLQFDKSDGFIVTKDINNTSNYVSSRVDFRNLKIVSYGNCYDLFSCEIENDSQISKGLSYSTFENLLLESKNGNGFYSTTPSRTTYANVFRNILFSVPNGACFCNSNIYLCSRIECCADLGSKYFFYNTFLRQTYVVSCNLGFGNKSSHVYYNDKTGVIGEQTAKFECCNFEEQNSNIFVNLDSNTACIFRFENCNFNMGNVKMGLNGKMVYLSTKNSKWNVMKLQYDKVKHAGSFAPCIGYSLYFDFDDACDFSWFNEFDKKKFPYIVDTFSSNKQKLSRVRCPHEQRYKVFLKDEGETLIKSSNDVSTSVEYGNM